MYRLSVEHRLLKDPSSLADNIARHIRDYQVYGKMVIVAEHPDTMLVELEQAWTSLKREMRHDIDHMESGERKSQLINQLMYMKDCHFVAKPPIDDPSEQVIIATPQQVLEWAPLCQTMFITCPMEASEQYRATAWMPPYGLLITYGMETEVK